MGSIWDMGRLRHSSLNRDYTELQDDQAELSVAMFILEINNPNRVLTHRDLDIANLTQNVRESVPYRLTPSPERNDLSSAIKQVNSMYGRSEGKIKENTPYTNNQKKKSSGSQRCSVIDLDHPWAHLVRPRRLCFERFTDDNVDSTLSLDIYKHVPADGYFNENFSHTLFPQLSVTSSIPERLPFIELQTFDDAVNFRRHSAEIIDNLILGKDETKREPSREKTADGTMPSLLVPPTVDERRPVLYQVVFACEDKQMLILEAKDFFVILPDRLDLHCIVLDEHSVNVQTQKRSFDRRLVSVKDFVWVWSVEGTVDNNHSHLETKSARLADLRETLEKSRQPRLSAYGKKAKFFFRAARFAFVTPAVRYENIYGVVMSLQKKWKPELNSWENTGFKAAFEGAPEAIKLNQSICDFAMNNIYADDILQAESRRNVSCAVRFSEPAASAAAQRRLCKLIKHFVPLHPDEGILPIMVRKLSGEDHEWIKDKLGNFSSYNLDPELARRKMSKMFNMACSALEAYRSLNDDRRVHRVSAQIPDITAPLLRLHVILEKMPKEFGWSPGKPVAVWVLGAEFVCNVQVEKVFMDCKEQQMRVTLAARRCSHNQLVRFVELASAGQTGPERTVMVCVKLGKLPTVANPLYETVVRMRLFDHLESWTLGYSILNLVYGRKVAPSKALALSINKDDKQTFTYVADDRWITLTKKQQHAVSLGCAGYPIVAIKAVFGSGKTLVAAIMASLLKKQKVIVTASENEVVAQLADTFCSVKELKDVTVLRYVPLGTTWKERHSTPVDLDEVLKSLGDELSADIHSPADRKICRMFKERLSASFNAQKREEFELVETNVSSLLRGILRIMFNVRFPDIICISTSSLLNVFNDGGIFADQKSAFSVLICDEAAQIPEPMFVAITDRLPHVRQVYIGDPLQFGPHARCSSSLIPAKLGAGSILNALLKVPLIPVSVMETSFTAHPKLNDLPRSLIDLQWALVRWNLSYRSTFSARLSFFSESRCSISLRQRYPEQFHTCKQNTLFVSPRWKRFKIFTMKSNSRVRNELLAYERTTVEFLEDENRLAVALTRARQGLIILGCKSFLEEGEYWKKIIAWAEMLNCIVSSSELYKFLGGPSTLKEEISPTPSPF
ncbi:hypothetical protein RB195_011715 [Necator americanus]|uniref:DNA2/NAM7 helicase-like C-terminal domain-containing protein n=1 Tax=Necator americanus TaxID=51031 RepID=A0ABR1D5D1_NECAM